MKVESVTQAICDLALRFGEGGDDRSEVIMVRAWQGRGNGAWYQSSPWNPRSSPLGVRFGRAGRLVWRY